MPRDKPTERVNRGFEETFSKMFVSILDLLVRTFLTGISRNVATDYVDCVWED